MSDPGDEMWDQEDYPKHLERGVGTAERGMPNFTSMKDFEINAACGDDASMWAAAFCQTCRKLGIEDVDEGWMIGWFANAIECSWQKRVNRAEPETRPIPQENLVPG